MSVATRRAIYGKMAGDSTLTGLLSTTRPGGFGQSIYYQTAPSGAGFPYVIFQLQADTARYAMATNGGAAALDDEVWLIKGVDKSTDADVVDTIKARLKTLLTDGTVTISGHTQCYLRRESGSGDYAEVQDGVRYLHAGSFFRLVYTTP